jgi:hypothetical protein
MIPLPCPSFSLGISVASTYFRNLALLALISLYLEEELEGISSVEEQKLL